jgi:hypothetical protein
VLQQSIVLKLRSSHASLYILLVLLCFASYRTAHAIHSLVVGSSDPFINEIQHILLFNSRRREESSNTKHSQASIDDLGLFSESKLQGGQVTKGFLVACQHGFVVGVVGVQQERVAKGGWANGGRERDKEKVHIGNEDNGTFVGDSLLSRDNGESAPVLEFQQGVRVRDQSVSLAVGTGADEKPSKHGVAAVPLFGLYRGTPAPLGKLRPLLFPVRDGIVVDLGVDKGFDTRNARE